MKVDIENPTDLLREIIFLNGVLCGARIEIPTLDNLTDLQNKLIGVKKCLKKLN